MEWPLQMSATMKTASSFLAASILVSLGCATHSGVGPDDFTGLGSDPKADSFTSRMELVGSLESGKTIEIDYTSQPRFRGAPFHAHQGDQVQVTVDAQDGDGVPILWLLDSRFQVADREEAVANGPDAMAAQITATIAADGEYYAVTREADLNNGTFELSLSGASACIQNVLCGQGSQFDPAACTCVEPCFQNVLCGGDFHFDQVLCTCVRTGQCIQNVECGGLAHFDFDVCECVQN
jgi:hypothetical protein